MSVGLTGVGGEERDYGVLGGDVSSLRTVHSDTWATWSVRAAAEVWKLGWEWESVKSSA